MSIILGMLNLIMFTNLILTVSLAENYFFNWCEDKTANI